MTADPPASNRAPGELRALTGARGIAAWLVVLYHIRGSMPWLPQAITPPIDHGYLSVDFFFLLSGFVMWLSWGDRLHRERWQAVPPFLRKRVARIWPLHALTLAATVAIALVLIMAGRGEPLAFPFRELPIQILLLQDWGLTRQLAWNAPSWSISAEMGAYLLFPVVVMMIDWRRVSTVALLALAAILLIGLCLALNASPKLGFDIPRLGMVRCLCEFHTGAIVCILWQRGDGRIAAALVALAMVGVWTIGWPETLVAPAFFAAVLYLLAAGPADNPLGRGVFHQLGETSYATYLCHYPLWIAFKLAFVRDVDDVPPVAIAAYLAIVLLASAILYHRFERRAQRWVEEWLRGAPMPARAAS